MLKNQSHLVHFHSWPQDALISYLTPALCRPYHFVLACAFSLKLSPESSYPQFSLKWVSALGAKNWEPGLLYLGNIVISKAEQSHFLTQGLNSWSQRAVSLPLSVLCIMILRVIEGSFSLLRVR